MRTIIIQKLGKEVNFENFEWKHLKTRNMDIEHSCFSGPDLRVSDLTIIFCQLFTMACSARMKSVQIFGIQLRIRIYYAYPRCSHFRFSVLNPVLPSCVLYENLLTFTMRNFSFQIFNQRRQVLQCEGLVACFRRGFGVGLGLVRRRLFLL